MYNNLYAGSSFSGELAPEINVVVAAGSTQTFYLVGAMAGTGTPLAFGNLNATLVQ